MIYQFGLVVGEEVVDCDDVYVFVCDCVQVCGQCGDEGFVFIGFYFGDVVQVEGGVIYDLYVVCVYVEGVFGGFVDGGECFWYQLIEGFVFFVMCVQFGGFVVQFVVGEFGDVFFQCFYCFDDLIQVVDDVFFIGVQQFFKRIGYGCYFFVSG